MRACISICNIFINNYINNSGTVHYVFILIIVPEAIVYFVCSYQYTNLKKGSDISCSTNNPSSHAVKKTLPIASSAKAESLVIVSKLQ